MPGENIHDWSTTAASNANADSSINWAEGQARASVNDSSRSMMAAHAKDRNLRNGSITTAGTANAQTFSSGLSYISSNLPVGLRPLLKIGAGLTNTGTTTLNCDGVGNASVKDQYGAELGAGQLRAGQYAEFRWDGTNWILLNPLPRVWTVTLITSTNASWPVPSGTTEMELEGWGGGASGGGLSQVSPGQRGAGGGAGGYFKKYYVSTMDTTLAVTIGAGGASSTTGAGGTNGGATTVVGANLGTLTANGGTGGGCALGGAPGGAGGTASGGDINLQGGGGGINGASPMFFGAGGDAPRGGMGGKENVGVAGQAPGGGGSGENHTGGGSGAGATGWVVIRTR